MATPGSEIIIVGVCAAGKSTLARRLNETGRAARTVAQEHSCIPDLWRWSEPETTIYLHASYQAVKRRRNSLMNPAGYEAQIHRLRRARDGAAIRVDTSDLTPEEVFRLVTARIGRDEAEREEPPLPVTDEPGSDIPSVPADPPLPIAEEPGEERETRRYPDLPIPEEL